MKSNEIIKFQNCDDNEEFNSIIKEINKEKAKVHLFYEMKQKIDIIYNDINSCINDFAEKLTNIKNRIVSNNNNKFGLRTFNSLSSTLNDIIKNLTKFKDKYNSIKNSNDANKSNKDVKINEELIIKMIKNKRNYFNEMKKYEIYLVFKQLSLITLFNSSQKSNIKYEDNFDKVIKKSQDFKQSEINLKNHLINIFDSINKERQFYYNSLFQTSQNFLTNFINMFDNLCKAFSHLMNNNIANKNEDYLIKKDIIFEKLFKNDIYSFKFLSKDYLYKKAKNLGSFEIINEKLDINNALEIFDDIDALKVIEEIEGKKIQLNEKDMKSCRILKNKKELESFINMIFNEPENIKKENKQKINNLFNEDIKNQEIFMQYLNNYRAQNVYFPNKLTIILLSHFLNLVINDGVKTNNYQIIQSVLIMSMTYYTTENGDEKNNNKIYIVNYLKDNINFKNKDFWINYFEELKENEINGLKERNNNVLNEKHKIIAIISSLYSLIKTLIDFDSELAFCVDIFNSLSVKYNIPNNENIDIANYIMIEHKESQEKKDIKK